MDAQAYAADPLAEGAPQTIAEIEAMFGVETDDDGNAINTDNPLKTPAEPAQAAPAKVEAKPAAEVAKVAEPELPIATADGKSQIPFEVLKASRSRVSELERENAELRNRPAPQAAPAPVVDPARVVAEAEVTSALESIRQESPELATVMDQILSSNRSKDVQIAALAQEVSKLNAGAGRYVEQAVAATVEEAVMANPKLAYIQSQSDLSQAGRDVYNEIATMDQTIRDNPKYNHLTMPERFSKVISMYEAVNGPIAMPATNTAAAVDPKAAASTAIAKAQASVAPPATLSDMPGGALPEAGNLEKATALGGPQMTEMFMGMTADQQDAWLAKLS